MTGLRKINWCFVISIVLWCVITLIRVVNHSSWYDEAHAWLIAQELNLFEIIKLMKIEGHTFIWYLCLMPFAKTNFMYPYSMLLLNWLFCFVAILILWLKSPFNNWIKFLISFSFPFLAMYPVVARCYAIGIMLLFMLAAMDNKKLEHPNWYALLLVICANTSVMAAVGATVLGGMFLFEIIKNKVKCIAPLTIMFLGSVLILLQLFGSQVDIIVEHYKFSKIFFYNVFFQNFYLNTFILLIIAIVSILFFVRNRIIPYFMIFSYLILFIIFFQYSGNIWHRFFFYIYFIIFCWLLFLKNNNLKWKSLMLGVLGFISFLYIFYKPVENVYKSVWFDKTKAIANIISNSDIFEKSNVIIYRYDYYAIVPYLRKMDIKFLNYCSGQDVNYDTTSFSRSKYCYVDSSYHNIKAYSQFDKVYDANRKNIILGLSRDDEKPVCNDKNKCYVFYPKNIIGNLYVHEIKKKQ